MKALLPSSLMLLGLALGLSAQSGCNSNSGDPEGGESGGASGGSGGGSVPDEPVDGLAEECGSLRMTEYGATDRRWCGFDRSSEILPDFVRRGMTVAIAEPFNGSSYRGDPGEACGECWQVSTAFGSEIVMVHDLCPIEGNPICAGSHFHFDVSNEVADSLDGGQWLGEAAAMRVPCPVTGNIHAYLTDRNEWGYLKLALFNHRLPIREVEYQVVGSDDWLPMERCLARWCAEDDAFSSGGPGAAFRFTSAAGEVIEGGELLSADIAAQSDFDTGLQFADPDVSEAQCSYKTPATIYDDAWGGITGVTWESNTWGDTVLSESSQDCHDGSDSCLLLDNFSGSGVHLTYRHLFAADEFSTLTLWLRTSGAEGDVDVAPRTEDSRCDNSTTVQVSGDWVQAVISIPEACPGSTELEGVTISFPSVDMDLVLDDLVFEE